MGWTSLDTAIERVRDRLGEDPAAARETIAQLLEETSSPSGRVRLYGLMIGAYRRLGDLEAGLRAYEAGRKLRGNRFARAELERHAAELHIVRNDRDSARRAADMAVELLHPLAVAPRGESKGARRKTRVTRALYAAALIARAQIAAHMEGDPTRLREALVDALQAVRWVDPRHAPRVHLSAVSAVSYLVTKVGTPKDAGDVLQLADEAERLIRGRVPARHPHRVRLRWIRALACARLGSTEQAERILSTVVADLLELGLEDDARRAGEHLLWIIAELGGHYGRARAERRRLGLPPEMDPPEPPKLDEVDPPIGF